jgi:hypothetical protein
VSLETQWESEREAEQEYDLFYARIMLFDCYSFEICLSLDVMPPALFLFYSGLLWLFGVFLGYIQVFKSAFYFCEECYGYFGRDYVDTVSCFGQYGYFNNILPIYACEVSF